MQELRTELLERLERSEQQLEWYTNDAKTLSTLVRCSNACVRILLLGGSA
jgi:hypothetical protein